jgi:hypothetical protein
LQFRRANSPQTREVENEKSYSFFSVTPIIAQIEKGNVKMVQYLIAVTKANASHFMGEAMKILIENKTDKAAEVVKMFQKYGIKLEMIDNKALGYVIKDGDLETIKFLHESGINLQGDCRPPRWRNDAPNCPIDLAAQHSKKVYQYLSEQGYKTAASLQQEQAKQNLAKLEEQIAEAIKANDDESIIQLCSGKDVPVCQENVKKIENKIRKLPANKLKDWQVEIYFDRDGYEQLGGDVIILEHSGQCKIRQGLYIQGYGKRLGQRTYTTKFGGKQVADVYKLLWCGNGTP